MLIKETATLHKVLSKYLAQQTVEVSYPSPGNAQTKADVSQGVMSEVLAAIVHRLSEEYSKVELKSEDAKKRYVCVSNPMCQADSKTGCLKMWLSLPPGYLPFPKLAKLSNRSRPWSRISQSLEDRWVKPWQGGCGRPARVPH